MGVTGYGYAFVQCELEVHGWHFESLITRVICSFRAWHFSMRSNRRT
jgi:hypothetical protein